MIIKDYNITQKESQKMIDDMAFDLVAYYKLLESAIYELLTKAQKNGWNEDRLIEEIDNLFYEENNQRIEKSLDKIGVNMPDVNPGESQNDFISRCVPIVMNEGKTQDQALGKCYGIYRQTKKSLLIETAKQLRDKIKKNKG